MNEAVNEAAPSAEPTVGVAARDTTAEKADTADTDDPQYEVVIPRLPQTLLPAFRKVFDSETRDAFWAADAEPQLTKLFQSQGVAGDALEEVACRKTVCRVEFRALDLEDKVLAALYTQLGKDYGTRLALDDGAHHDAERAALYVLRDGYTLDEPAR